MLQNKSKIKISKFKLIYRVRFITHGSKTNRQQKHCKEKA